MVLLVNDMFLTELTKLYQKAKPNGSVTLIIKQYDGRTRPHPRTGAQPQRNVPQEKLCLIRAKFRSKKISTIIHQRDVNKFQVAFSSLLKGNLDGLKKLKKSKSKTNKND